VSVTEEVRNEAVTKKTGDEKEDHDEERNDSKLNCLLGIYFSGLRWLVLHRKGKLSTWTEVSVCGQ
jgi:hypothetical protein